MKSSVEDVSSLEKKLTVEVPQEAVKKSFDSAYAEVQKTANIKGFRKGKAPMDKIRALYSDRVTPDVLNNLVNSNYQKALDEHGLIPIDYPQINVDSFDEKSLKFTATLEIRPNVEVKDYEGLSIEKEKLVVKDEQINQILENMQQSRASNEVLLEDRPAANGDVAVIDFDGQLSDGPLPGGQASDFELELGSNQFIPGFEEAVVGMKIGDEKSFPVTFPEDYHAAEIAGKGVTFKVNLKSLKKKVIPELNDEFAKSMGEHETLEELKNAIREDVEKGEEKRIKDELKDRLLRALIERNPIEVPNSMVEKQKEALIQNMQQRMQQQGMGPKDFEDYKSKWDEDFARTSKQMVQSSFLTGALADQLKLHANDEDFEKKLKDYAAETGIEIERLQEFYGKPDQRGRLDYQITEDKVIEVLLSTAKIKEIEGDKLKKA